MKSDSAGGGQPRHKESLTRALRLAIKSDFARFLAERGFERYRATDSSGLDYFFRRRVGEKWQLLQVQFDRYQRSKFVLEFGQFHAGRLIDPYGRHVRDEDARCFHLAQRARLYRWRKLLFWSWFGVTAVSARIIGRDHAIMKEIRRLEELFPQVEHWLEHGAIGPNVSVF